MNVEEQETVRVGSRTKNEITLEVKMTFPRHKPNLLDSWRFWLGDRAKEVSVKVDVDSVIRALETAILDEPSTAERKE